MLFAAGPHERRRVRSCGTTRTPTWCRGSTPGTSTPAVDIVETNTFGGTRLKLNEYKIGDRTRELNEKGARLARAAAPAAGYVAGSIGPTSRLPHRLRARRRRHRRGVRRDVSRASRGARRGRCRSLRGRDHDVSAGGAPRRSEPARRSPICRSWPRCSSSTRSSTTATGPCGARVPAEVAKNLLAAGADVVGMNCGRGPDRAHRDHPRDARVTDAPLVAYPNAGLPVTTRRHRDVRARARRDGARVPGAPGRRMQHRRRVLRLEPRAHPPYRRGRAGAPAASVVAQQLPTRLPRLHDAPARDRPATRFCASRATRSPSTHPVPRCWRSSMKRWRSAAP